MSVFGNFRAYPVTSGNALYTNWVFTASFVSSVTNQTNIPQFLYIYVTDYNSVAAGNTISSPVVVPLKDASNNLTTQFTIDNNTPGMAFDIENGTRYHIMAQMVYQDASNSIVSSNSSQSVITCSTTPEVPNFQLTPTTGAFELKLLYGSVSPTPVSAFDGYGILKGIFVTYASGSQLYSRFIPNDASNSLYSSVHKIDASLNTYEVSVASYNYNSEIAPNGTLVKWGGRSNTSQSQVVVVDDTPGPVTNLRVYETMADFSNNMTQASTFTSVSNTIKWNLPTVGASSETISGYNIYRNNVVIANISSSNPNFSARTYTDDTSSLQVGQLYSYTVTALNDNGEGAAATPMSLIGVVFPTQFNLTVDPSGSQALALRVTNANNGFPLNSYRFDFSYNGTLMSDISSNPYRLTNLTNNTTYNVQSRTSVRSLTSDVSYNTSYWMPPVQGVPFNPVAPDPRDMSANPFDVSGNPTGTIALRWINSDVSAVGFTGQLSYTLSYKLTTAPDASYVIQQNNINCLSNQISTYTMPSGILSLGSSYMFRVFNTLIGTGTNAGKTAVSGYLISDPVTSFVVPGPVRNLALTNPTVNDMSYSWLPPSSTGGLILSSYYAELRLLNDGSNVVIRAVSSNDVSGNLATLFGSQLVQGSKYQLDVQASVVLSGQSFRGPSQSVINFTVPQGLNAPSGTNFSNGTLLNGIQISWGTNSQYSALDASNVTFNIYKNGSPSALATGVFGTSYLDTTPLIGSINSYQVVPVVNGVAGRYVSGSVPTPSSSVRRMQLPNQPTNLNVNSRTASSLNFSWTASTGGSGNDASLNYFWTLTDASGNIDASGVTLTTSALANNLDSAGVYTLSVRTGVVNPENGQIYYNTTSVPQITVPLYNTPLQAGFITIYGSQALSSNGALLINLTNASAVTGLTFASYRIQLSTDASFINNLITQTSSNSEFYISGLTNATKYFVRAYNIYTDAQSNNVLSPASNTAEGTPTPSPAQPLGVLANTEAQNAITVYWDLPSQSTIQPSSYAVNVGTNPSDTIPTTVTFQAISDFSYNTTTRKYYKTINNLSFGQIYYINVIAGIQLTNSIAVSQPSIQITAVPYTTPSAPQNFNNIVGETTVVSSWNAPSNSGGAGIGLNGIMLYQLELSQDPSFINVTTNVNGVEATTYTFSGLLTNTTYNVRVRGYFAIQGSQSTFSYGPFAQQLNIVTQSLPIEPTISNVTADNTLLGGSQAGRTVLIDYTIDPTKSTSLTLKRRILDPTGTTQLDSYRVIDSRTVNANNIGSGQFIDISSNAGAANFLNGNMMQYILDVSYSIIGGSPYVTSTLPSTMVAPYGKPIPTDSSGNVIDLSSCIIPINPDASGGYTSFILKINKNGSNLNNLVAVGLPNTGNQAYVINQSSQTNNLNITYNNPQVDNKIAANQYAEYQLDYTGVLQGTNINNTLVIESNKGGALLAKQPDNGIFGPN